MGKQKRNILPVSWTLMIEIWQDKKGKTKDETDDQRESKTEGKRAEEKTEGITEGKTEGKAKDKMEGKTECKPKRRQNRRRNGLRLRKESEEIPAIGTGVAILQAECPNFHMAPMCSPYRSSHQMTMEMLTGKQEGFVAHRWIWQAAILADLIYNLLFSC